ncbi:uncharacterized protein FA14DRAFT_123953 [Meira miltonrushii]|uniref:Mediator of RNA polymerase II transcription subunit 8 n=1 Tax=Meira miltonrushii TaxID=1280837 RepID=A0A316VFX4_9BASI|nr:uncharacterized protein FA14DRAFT_123953 [Meira miltonrushii]PWN34385.1 hypothetical protein FA14DRAFT_123953 [Meira miltonrushii]
MPTLAKAPLPLEQLTQLQRRMAHLLNSVTELQDHVMNAQTLDEWPSLLSRHLTIVSQTHSLSQFISLANPNNLNAQLAKRDEILMEDAMQNNKFSQDDGDRQGDGGVGISGSNASHDALYGGKPGAEKSSEAEDGPRLPKLTYSEGENNPLRKAAPHPFYPLDAEKAQTVIPSLLLPRGLDGKVTEDADRRWQEWLKTYAGIQDPLPNSKEMVSIDMETKRAWIEQMHNQIREFDTFASKATRSYIHAREATDELGQRYDWKMRLAPDEDSDQEDVEGEEEDIKMDEDTNEAEDRKRKREDEDVQSGKEVSLKSVQQFLKSGQV